MQVLATVGLARPTRPRGFCPACRGWRPASEAGREVARPALMALLTLIAAGGAWAVLLVQARAMGGMTSGLGPLPAFLSGWTAMTVAMMVPSAVPFISEFARGAEGRRAWPLATALLAATYVGVWVAFGVLCFVAYDLLKMPWPRQAIVAGASLVLAGLYGLTPIKRRCEARCRELCALHGPLPFSLRSTALLAGARYGLSCVGCTAGVMVAALLIGMSNLAWVGVLTVLVLVYKLAPVPGPWPRALLALTLVALGPTYVLVTA